MLEENEVLLNLDDYKLFSGTRRECWFKKRRFLGLRDYGADAPCSSDLVIYVHEIGKSYIYICSRHEKVVTSKWWSRYA